MFVCQLGRPSLSRVQHFPFYFSLDLLHFLEISLVFSSLESLSVLGRNVKATSSFFSFFLYFFLSFFPQFCGLSTHAIFAYISLKKVLKITPLFSCNVRNVKRFLFRSDNF